MVPLAVVRLGGLLTLIGFRMLQWSSSQMFSMTLTLLERYSHGRFRVKIQLNLSPHGPPAQVEPLAEGVYALITGDDPNTGFIVGERGVVVVDARATPALAQETLTAIRSVTASRCVSWCSHITMCACTRCLGTWCRAYRGPSWHTLPHQRTWSAGF